MFKHFISIVFFLLLSSKCLAQIEIIVPFGVGGPADIITRTIFQSYDKQNTIIVNKPGASQNIGYQYFVNCKKTCLLLTFQSLYTNKNKFPDGYPPNLIENAIPLYYLGYTPAVFVINNTLQVSNISELINLSRKKPIIFGYGGHGPVHDLMKDFCTIANCELIPYKSGSAALNDLMGGVVHVYPGSAPIIESVRNNSRLKILSVFNDERIKDLNYETISEIQNKKLDGKSHYFIFSNRTIQNNKETGEIIEYLKNLHDDLFRKMFIYGERGTKSFEFWKDIEKKYAIQ